MLKLAWQLLDKENKLQNLVLNHQLFYIIFIFVTRNTSVSQMFCNICVHAHLWLKKFKLWKVPAAVSNIGVVVLYTGKKNNNNADV